MDTVSSELQSDIFHFVHMRGLGGVQIAFDNVIGVLAERGGASITHHVVSPRGCDQCYSNARAFLGPISQLSAAASYFRMRSRKRSIGHFHNLLSSKNVSQLNSLLPARSVILHEHGGAWNVADGDPLVRKNAQSANLILCNSKAAALLLTEKFGIREDKIAVVLNGIFDARRLPELAPSLELERSEFTIGFLGRLEANKGVHVLLQAFQMLSSELRSRARVLVYGDGALRALFEQRFGNDNRISFLGRTADPMQAIGRMNLVVVPSIREPFGNVVAEAGLRGVPVIAANVDGIPEAVGDTDNAVLIDPSEPVDQEFTRGSSVPLPERVYFPTQKSFSSPRQIDPGKLRDVLADAMVDYDRYRQKALLHRQFVVDRMSVQAHADALLGVYSSLM